MPKVQLAFKEITGSKTLKVEVGTNCPKCGDAGHEGRTVLRLYTVEDSTGMAARVNDGALVDAKFFEIRLGGEAECDTFIEALEFAAQTLRAQVKCNSIKREEEID